MLVKYIRTKSRAPKGMLVADVTDGDRVGIGFSLCKFRKPGVPGDRFNKERGKQIAVCRANKYQLYSSVARNSAGEFRIAQSDASRNSVAIPNTVIRELPGFIHRCRTYFRDKKLPPWSLDFLIYSPTEDEISKSGIVELPVGPNLAEQHDGTERWDEPYE